MHAGFSLLWFHNWDIVCKKVRCLSLVDYINTELPLSPKLITSLRSSRFCDMFSFPPYLLIVLQLHEIVSCVICCFTFSHVQVTLKGTLSPSFCFFFFNINISFLWVTSLFQSSVDFSFSFLYKQHRNNIEHFLVLTFYDINVKSEISL